MPINNTLNNAKVVSITNIAGTVNNGPLNNGFRSTIVTNAITLTIDSVVCTEGDRILLTGQTNSAYNGLWDVTYVAANNPGRVVTNVTLTRSNDFQSIEQLSAGSIVTITNGTVYKGSAWVLVNSLPNRIGVDAITFLNNTTSSGLTLGTVGSSPNPNAATIVSNVLRLQPANISNPGVVTIDIQSFSGQKTWEGQQIDDAEGRIGFGLQVSLTNNISVSDILSSTYFTVSGPNLTFPSAAAMFGAWPNPLTGSTRTITVYNSGTVNLSFTMGLNTGGGIYGNAITPGTSRKITIVLSRLGQDSYNLWIEGDNSYGLTATIATSVSSPQLFTTTHFNCTTATLAFPAPASMVGGWQGPCVSGSNRYITMYNATGAPLVISGGSGILILGVNAQPVSSCRQIVIAIRSATSGAESYDIRLC